MLNFHDTPVPGFERSCNSSRDELIDAFPRELYDELALREHREDLAVDFECRGAELPSFATDGGVTDASVLKRVTSSAKNAAASWGAPWAAIADDAG